MAAVTNASRTPVPLPRQVSSAPKTTQTALNALESTYSIEKGNSNRSVAISVILGTLSLALTAAAVSLTVLSVLGMVTIAPYLPLLIGLGAGAVICMILFGISIKSNQVSSAILEQLEKQGAGKQALEKTPPIAFYLDVQQARNRSIISATIFALVTAAATAALVLILVGAPFSLPAVVGLSALILVSAIILGLCIRSSLVSKEVLDQFDRVQGGENFGERRKVFLSLDSAGKTQANSRTVNQILFNWELFLKALKIQKPA